MEQQQNNPAQAGQGQQQQMQVKVTDEVLRGVYANMVQVAHTPEEFIIDFMNLFPPSGIITSRVVVSPAHMKRIAQALAENIKRFEEQFGKIAESTAPQQNFGFRTE